MNFIKCLWALLILSGSVMSADEQLQIKQIMEKIAEGNHLICGGEECAILLLGNTGSGKSTTAYRLMAQSLQGIFNDETGDIVVDAVEPKEELKISHSKASETKIPNKCSYAEMISKCVLTTNVVVWDCPGFNDTDIKQEIANCFYNRKLHNLHQKLKFVLVASHGSLADKGTAFVSSLQMFCNSFKNIDSVKDSVSIIITGVPHRKSVDHLRNTLISIQNQHESLSAEAKKMLAYITPKIIPFYMPEKEGLLPISDEMSTKINSMSHYVEAKNDLGKFSLSPKALHYCRKLLDISGSNLEFLVSVLSHSIKNIESCNDNLETSYASIRSWLPTKIAYKNSNYAHSCDSRFVKIKQLNKLLGAMEPIKNTKNNDLDALIKIMKNLFWAFEEYVLEDKNSSVEKTRGIKEKIQHFAYATQQMVEYHQLFASIMNENTDTLNNELSAKIYNFLNQSHDDLKQKLQQAVIGLEINYTLTDVNYYSEAIDILSLEPQNQDCIKKRAVCHKLIGCHLKEKNELDGALEYFKKSLALDKKDAQSYNHIGDILVKQGKYDDAVKYFQVVENARKIKECFKSLQVQEMMNADFYERFGDTWSSLGMFSEAQKLYMNAKSLATTEDKHKSLHEKIILCLDPKTAADYMKKYTETPKSGSYFNF